MKLQRENSVGDCIESVEREDIHQMDEFKSGLVPGMPSCIDDLVLDYVLHQHEKCSNCDRFFCSEGCDDGIYIIQCCMSCEMELCDHCAPSYMHNIPWVFCDECCRNVCGNCLHECYCYTPTTLFHNTCSGCQDNE